MKFGDFPESFLSKAAKNENEYSRNQIFSASDLRHAPVVLAPARQYRPSSPCLISAIVRLHWIITIERRISPHMAKYSLALNRSFRALNLSICHRTHNHEIEITNL
jgi:hypothetical protein